jgi:hypothetical protein
MEKMTLPRYLVVEKVEQRNMWGAVRHKNLIHSVWYCKAKAEAALMQLNNLYPEKGYRIEETTYETYRDISLSTD